MTTKNRGGRPPNSRNKTSATSEIKKALSKGMGLLELKIFLEEQMKLPNISEQQRNKYLDKHWELMKLIIQENLKVESVKEESPLKESKEIHKGENTDNTPAKSDKVARLSFGSK